MSAVILMELPLVPGKKEEATELFAEFLPQTRTHDGCEEVSMYFEQGDESTLVLFERWETKAHHDAYLQWRGSRPEDGARMQALLAGPPAMRILERGA